MRGRRTYVVAVAAWVLVVAAGSTLVWAVISRAGEGVVAGAGAAATPGVPRPPAPAQRPSGTPTVVPTPQPSTTQPPAARRGTWQGAAGVVVSECRRSAIRLLGAYPNSGWSVQVEDRGPLRLVVHFEGGEDRGETGLGARCVQGTPSYAVSGDGSGDS